MALKRFKIFNLL